MKIFFHNFIRNVKIDIDLTVNYNARFNVQGGKDMIINEFAKLCSCKTQTLRYYDSIDLLKPVKVDKYTGYRYYEPEQALQYVKIKKLQEASFSINEIKELLSADEKTICEAIKSKIDQLKGEISTLNKIIKSYQKDYMKTKEKISSIQKALLSSINSFDFKKEFGFTKEEYEEIIDIAVETLNEGVSFLEVQGEPDETPTEENYILVYEKECKKDFVGLFNDLPELETGEYYLFVSLDIVHFPNVSIYTNVIINLFTCRLNENSNAEVCLEPSNVNVVKVYKKK